MQRTHPVSGKQAGEGEVADVFAACTMVADDARVSRAAAAEEALGIEGYGRQLQVERCLQDRHVELDAHVDRAAHAAAHISSLRGDRPRGEQGQRGYAGVVSRGVSREDKQGNKQGLGRGCRQGG